MTDGSHNHPDKYLGVTSGGPSAAPLLTVRCSWVLQAVLPYLPVGAARLAAGP